MLFHNTNSYSTSAILTLFSIALASCGGGNGGVGEGDNDVEVVGNEPPALTRNVDLVYIANPLGVNELFVTSGDGVTHRSSTTGSSGAGVSIFETSPNGRYIAMYRENDPGVIELYVDDLTDADEAYRVNGPLTASGNVINFKWSPDSTHLAYTADQEVDGTEELYVVPAAGGAWVKLHPAQVGGQDVTKIYWSPDSQRVAFIANHDTALVPELYLANRDGMNHLKLNKAITAGSGVETNSVKWSPAGNRLIYVADTNDNGWVDLFVVNADGSDNTKLNSAGSVGLKNHWSPDGHRVLYHADQDLEGVFELYTRTMGIIPVTNKINGPLAMNGDVSSHFSWAPDGSSIVYIADQDIDGVNELYTSEPDGSNNTKLNPSFVAGQSVNQFKWSPNSIKVAYRANQDDPGIMELYVSDIAATFNIKISNAISTNIKYSSWLPDSSAIIYIADQDTAGSDELYLKTASVGVKVLNYKFNDSLVAGGNVNFFRISPDGINILYQADQDTDTVGELYTVPVSNSTTPVKVSTAMALGSEVLGADWLPALVLQD